VALSPLRTSYCIPSPPLVSSPLLFLPFPLHCIALSCCMIKAAHPHPSLVARSLIISPSRSQPTLSPRFVHPIPSAATVLVQYSTVQYSTDKHTSTHALSLHHRPTSTFPSFASSRITSLSHGLRLPTASIIAVGQALLNWVALVILPPSPQLLQYAFLAISAPAESYGWVSFG
jgi:hypothetical protein